ncbi:PREDICTED: uncharacterized protein LOC106808780 [Priapulus caudatus]|uniref:Reelin n=1 Tax=Priapulus caudatus TaxID=37621 RepID=A0ABM1E4J6_PRICU|nr:PREDICTED: uncharacterized protein LOC106808780 [Priapulus caudatus]
MQFPSRKFRTTWAVKDVYIGRTCPDMCANHGVCHRSVCLCDTGYTGANCTTRVQLKPATTPAPMPDSTHPPSKTLDPGIRPAATPPPTRRYSDLPPTSEIPEDINAGEAPDTGEQELWFPDGEMLPDEDYEQLTFEPDLEDFEPVPEAIQDDQVCVATYM